MLCECEICLAKHKINFHFILFSVTTTLATGLGYTIDYAAVYRMASHVHLQTHSYLREGLRVEETARVHRTLSYTHMNNMPNSAKTVTCNIEFRLQLQSCEVLYHFNYLNTLFNVFSVIQHNKKNKIYIYPLIYAPHLRLRD